MRHGGHGYHEASCGCWLCSRELWGDTLLYNLYSTRKAHNIQQLVLWVTEALESWLPSLWGGSEVHFTRRRVSVLACERREYRSGEATFIYRIVVVLPMEVHWDRLWEKLLCKRGMRETGLSLRQGDSGRQNHVSPYVWYGMRGLPQEGKEQMVASFQKYQQMCENFLRTGWKGEVFGTRESYIEIWKRWRRIEQGIEQGSFQKWAKGYRLWRMNDVLSVEDRGSDEENRSDLMGQEE